MNTTKKSRIIYIIPSKHFVCVPNISFYKLSVYIYVLYSKNCLIFIRFQESWLQFESNCDRHF